MKHVRKRKKSAKVAGWCILIVLFALIIWVGIWFFWGNREKEKMDLPPAAAEQKQPSAQAESTAVPEPTVSPEEESVPEEIPVVSEEPAAFDSMIELETPYCILYFPEMWEDVLDIHPVEEDGYRMEFSVRFEDDTVYRVFDVSFDIPNGIPLGVVAGMDGVGAAVYIQFYEPDEALTEDRLQTFLAMQEDANRLIECLPVKEDLQPGEPTKDILIQTPYCQLVYPAQWAKNLVVEQSGETDHTVDFYAQFGESEKIHLFSVQLSPNTEDAVMVMDWENDSEIGVHVQLSEIDETVLSAEHLETAHAMQDEINALLDHLSAYIGN